MVTIRLNTADLKALAKAPDARVSAIHLEDPDDPEALGEVIVCDADMVLGPALEVIQVLATELLAARGALDLRTRARVDDAGARIASLEEQVAEKQRWIDGAVASCAKRQCSTRDERLASTLADIERRQRWATTGRW
jgi:hypothetical protein